MRLTLLRHAKSSWNQPGLADHDRPLSPRGERDAVTMSARLAARGARPALIWSSSAARALATARQLAETLELPPERLRSSRRLYLAGPRRILEFVMEQPAEWPDLVVVGHNPGFTALANRLAPELGLDNLPTAGCVVADFPVRTWSGIGQTPATRVWWDYPKKPRRT